MNQPNKETIEAAFNALIASIKREHPYIAHYLSTGKLRFDDSLNNAALFLGQEAFDLTSHPSTVAVISEHWKRMQSGAGIDTPLNLVHFNGFDPQEKEDPEREVSTEDQHENMVDMLAKCGCEIVEEQNPMKAHLSHMALGVAGEAGELVDCIKKHTIYNQNLDSENLIEELGDLEFYLSGIRQSLMITREQTLKANIAKLQERYPAGGYSDADAKTRKDKA